MNATNFNHNWCDSTVFTEKEDRIEIIRRVDLIKQHLISDLLASSGHIISTSGILNHITVLLQLPVIILLYETSNDGRQATWRRHFDFKKTKASRGGLIFKNNLGEEVNQETPIELFKGKSDNLFKLFETRYSLRVFILEDPSTAADIFHEIETNREQRQKDYKANKETEKNNKREYVRLCLFGLFDVGADDELNFGRAFLQIIQGKIEKIADAQEYKPPPKNRRDKTTLPKNADGSDSNTSKTVEKYMAEVSGQESGLNLLYGRAKFASRAIKSILQAKNTRNAIDGYKPAPNLIFSLRSYDRSTPRSEREIDGNNPFNGYMHNTSFALPAGQRWHIKKYLESLLRLGPDSYDSERYGADDWASLTNDYKNFARTLDRWFWYILRTKDGVDTLLNVMSSRVGSTATSFVDPVFYYGSALYRMPFRKQGGLDRLYGLQDIYEALPSEEKMKFGFRHVTKRRINKLGFSWDERKIEELQRDCLRVVTFFYITRMLGPDITSKGEYWTKILLFPLDVSGAVVGTLGCISFERKTQHVGQKLPSERTFWNQEFYFFSEIFSSSQQFLRQQYRNFQIKHICDAYRASLLGLVVEAFENKNKTPPPESLANLVDALNSETEILARVCPYPRYKFQLKVALQSSEMPEKVSASDKDAFREYLRKLQSMTFSVRPEDADNNDTEWSIRIGTRLRLVFSWDRANDIFRAHHSLPGLGLVHEENLQLLQSKLSETTKIVLERAAELITANKK